MQQNSIPRARVELCGGWSCQFRPATRWVVTGSGPQLSQTPLCDACFWLWSSSPYVTLHLSRGYATGRFSPDELEPLRAHLTSPQLFEPGPRSRPRRRR